MVQLTMKINGTEVPREQTKGLSPTLKDAINSFREKEETMDKNQKYPLIILVFKYEIEKAKNNVEWAREHSWDTREALEEELDLLKKDLYRFRKKHTRKDSRNDCRKTN